MSRSGTLKGHDLLIYADSERNADLLYATRFLAGDPFVFIRTRRGRRHLFMSDLEIDRARKESNAHTLHRITTYVARARERFGRSAGTAETLVCVLDYFKLRRISVPESFPVGIADRMRRHGVRVSPLPSPLFPRRLVKTPEEIKAIRKACRATECGVQAAMDVLKKSRITRGYLLYDGKRLTSERLRAIIDTTVLAQGYLPAYTIVASGLHACDPHDRGSGFIRAHVPLIIDVFPRSAASGYFADITRTVVRGRASRHVKEMYRAVYDAQRQAVRAVRPGVRGRAIHRDVQQLFQKRGFETGDKDGRMVGFFHGTGHGLGLEIHEAPRIGAAPDVLKRGMVVTVEPGLYYPPHGGIRIEDTVVVTPDGASALTRFPKFLEI